MPLVPDMPTDWVNGKKITPNGETEGDERYGYNYLMRKINQIITFLNGQEVDILSKIQFENVEELPDPTTADPYTIYRYPDPSAKPGEVLYLCSYAMNGKWFPLGGNGRVDDEISSTSTNPVQNKIIYNELAKKLDIYDYIIDSELKPDSTNPVQNRVLTPLLNELERRPFGIRIKGRVPTISDLPPDPQKNDSYWVESENRVYSWNEEEWVDMGQVIDMSDFYTKEDIDNLPSVRSGINEQKVAEYDAIKQSVPPSASADDPLTSRSYVDKQIQENSAYFCGRWDTYQSIPTNESDFEEAGFNTPGFNNYLVVASDETAPEPLTGASFRYIYDSHIDEGNPYDKSNWKRQYFVNEKPMTSSEIAALESGVTQQKVANYDNHLTNSEIHITEEERERWDAKQGSLTADQMKAVNSGITGIPTTIPENPQPGQVLSISVLKENVEEWEFTLDDGTTVTKKVVVLS